MLCFPIVKSPIKTKIPKGAAGAVLDDEEPKSSSSSEFIDASEKKISDLSGRSILVGLMKTVLFIFIIIFLEMEPDSEGSNEKKEIFSGRFPSRVKPTSPKKSTPSELNRTPISGTPKVSKTTLRSSPNNQPPLTSPRSVIPVPRRQVSLFAEKSPNNSNSTTDQVPPEDLPQTEEAPVLSKSKRPPLNAGPLARTGTPSISIKGTPTKSEGPNPKEIQVTPLTSTKGNSGK